MIGAIVVVASNVFGTSYKHIQDARIEKWAEKCKLSVSDINTLWEVFSVHGMMFHFRLNGNNLFELDKLERGVITVDDIFVKILQGLHQQTFYFYF